MDRIPAPPGDPANADARAEHLRLVEKTGRRSRGRSVFARESAALIHGLPLVGAIPQRVQMIAPRSSGGRITGDRHE